MRYNSTNRYFPKKVENIINEQISIYLSSAKETRIKDLVEVIYIKIKDTNMLLSEDQKLPLPSAGTIYRKVNSQRGRRNGSELRRQSPLTRPLQKVKVVFTKLDLILFDGGKKNFISRPTIITLLDLYSGFPLGCYVGFELPSTALQALQNAIAPKSQE
jgi:putative transposase